MKMNSSVSFDGANGHPVPLRLLRRSEAAQYVRETFGIPLSQKTLSKLAVVGGGPLFRKAGRFPLYEVADLNSWANGRLGPKQRSTSDRMRAVHDLDADADQQADADRQDAGPMPSRSTRE
jgi:hypothetical protein